ncbi:MAG: queuosine precursor transporter [Archaeoglobus sp.]|uniref:queuosine precursor transporter n=1 Tax=Archaeoglobus sp. TaxID=1872626 RepID=UPI001E064258|nr:queuosine precursor transporter [Archaeoglobus sp.]MBO8180279.1 queuosine precursor transporter [Archaeoglobus sp.]
MQWGLFILWALLTLGSVTAGVVTARKLGKEAFVGLYAGLTIVANIIAAKLIMIGNFVVPAAVLVYSSTYLLTDIIDEVYGRKLGHKTVLTGFVANVLGVLAIWLSVKWAPAPFIPAEFQDAYTKVLGQAPRIVFASTISYLISQNHDVWAFHFWKEKTGGKYLWLRNNLSTMVSQLLDTVIFITLAFYGTVPLAILIGMIKGQYIAKVMIALLDTPFCYLGVRLMKRERKE